VLSNEEKFNKAIRIITEKLLEVEERDVDF